ncbi:gamma-glutamyltransferase family protein [Poriferisphaera sp. WC338]|uniref:gamma-glutamyltransferase family protein n=1 Tax=Poriferisphaera sp. WC338 TaxID=3425129 RepID=UPI003D81B455
MKALRTYLFPIIALTFLLILNPTVYAAAQTASGKKHAVVAGHPVATKNGMMILEQGGNAVDAAVAVSLSLGVVEPYGSGIGGKIIFLYYEAATGKVHSIEALGAAPMNTDVKTFTSTPQSKRKYTIHAAATPGLLAGIHAAHKQYGTLSWVDVMKPAIKTAADGYIIDAKQHRIYKNAASRLRKNAAASELYLIDNNAPPIGYRMKNPDLAESYISIAQNGIDAFYNGAITTQFIHSSKKLDGWHSEEDFHDYQPRIIKPLRIKYKNFDVYSSPPPLIGGITLALSLRCLDAIKPDWSSIEPHDPEHMNLLGSVLQEVYSQFAMVTADTPDAYKRTLKLLTSKNVSAMKNRIKLRMAATNELFPLSSIKDDETLDDSLQACTSHFVIVDQFGNMVSATQSLGSKFGSAIVIPGTGILLNNSMNNFATRTKSSPNYIEPGKRPRSTMTPTIMVGQNNFIVGLGAPGGQRIPTAVLQVVTDFINHGITFEEAINLPRFHIRRNFTRAEKRKFLDIESATPQSYDADMESRSWTIERYKRSAYYFGGVNIGGIDSNGLRFGVADDRRTNHAEAE